jgi:3-oxoacyl-[acyl-carrier-protein] synthase II
MRRIVVTGVGLVTPLGADVNHTWKRLLASESGAGKIRQFDASDLSCQVAMELKCGDGAGEFNADAILAPKDQKKIDPFILYAIAASKEAVKDSGWEAKTDEQQIRSGVMIGSGIGGLQKIEDGVNLLRDKGARRISPFFIPGCLINLASGHVSIEYGFRGPNHSVVTACSTGAHAIGDAAEIIKRGDADVMVAGGAEAAICKIGIAGFMAARALSTAFNDTPEKASRPWDKDRDGFVMGEGAGIVVLEEYEHAKARGAKIYGELLGYGLSGDAYHITAPAEGHEGAYRAMQMALKKAQLGTDKIGYVNAHGTSTPLGDALELQAVKRLFGSDAYNISMSSTKSAVGHLLGAAGSVEAIFTLLSLRDQVCPPTLNLDNPSEGCDLDLVAHTAKDKKMDYALSNAFGFGGTNSSLVFGRI